ncbi:MAG: transporter substrate-binding domain-containing protein [Rhizobiales bacterium]|nr:transporter substrate-binding domain-containing protein [Hyphomicrobiales bacterium]
MRLNWVVSIVIAALPVLAFAQSAPAQALKKVRVGNVAPIATDWPHFVANEKGLYRREGIDAEITYVGNVANTVQQLAGGSFDVAVSTFDTALRAIARGADAVMIGGGVIKYPYSVMSAKNVDKVADLKGKRIVLPFNRDLLTIVWNRWVTEQGMKPADIDQVYDGATPNRFAALTSGTVQAALLGQPFDFKAQEQGYKKLVDLGAYAKDYGFLVFLGRPQWLKANPDAAKAYLRALSAAIDWIYDPKNRDEAIAILAKGTKLDTTSAALTYDYYVKDLQPFSRKLAVPQAIVDGTVKTLVELGDIKQPTKSMVDTSYLPK